MKLPLFRVAAACAALVSVCRADTVRAVNFNGSAGTLVTATQTLRGASPAAVLGDLNGDGITDSYVQYPFSATTPLSPTSGYTGPRFFGGIRGEALHTAAGQGGITFGERGVVQGTADFLGVRYQVDSPRVGRVWMVVYFDKADFVGGASSQPVKFDWKSKLALSSARMDSLGTVRWVVREGTQFYVSEATVSGTAAELKFANNTTDGRWAPYDPAASLDFAQASAVFSERNFQNITAVGLLVDKDAFSTARSWIQLKDFFADVFVGSGDGTPNLAPVPAFSTTLTPASGRAPVSAAFNASGTVDAEGDTLTYAWQFGDGSTGTGVSVTHAYNTPGTYDVVLTVTDTFGNSATKSSTVLVRAPNVPPTAAFTVTSARGDIPFTVGFSGATSVDSDGVISNYSWAFGDGEVGSGAAVNHTYTVAGRYTARLTVTDDDGATATVTKTIDATINGTLPPIAVISTDLSTGYAPLTVDLSGGGSYDLDGDVVAYRWDFGDGTTANGPTATHTWNAEGSYVVALTVTDNNGVSGTATTLIKVGPPVYTLQTEGHVRLLGNLLIRQGTGVFTLSGGGVGLRAESGQYYFLYQELNGDGEFSARVVGFSADSHAWASAGVMAMAKAQFGQPFVASVVTQGKGLFAYSRPAVGVESASVNAAGMAPYYVKVARLGQQLTSYVSPDGQSWQLLSSATVADLPQVIAVGLVVAGGQNGQPTTATFDNVVPPRTCGSPTGGPTDNPVATRYGATAYPWSDEINWKCVYNINDYAGANDDERYHAAWTAALEGGGGVIYFPAGTYTFAQDLYLSNGIVLRGETPTNADAKTATFRPATKFVFPKYEPSFSGSGTANGTAFKRIRTVSPNSDSNLGLVYIDVNRAGITLKGDATTGTNRNIVILGVRQNNVAEPDAAVPGSNAYMNAWQRWPNRFTDNIGVQALENVLVANSRINDETTDDFEQPGYVVEDTSQAVGSPGRFVTLAGSQARFRYTDHYGISVNRSKSSPYSLAATPETEPSLFRQGIVIRDNWIFATMRVKIHAAGDGAVIADNVLKDEQGKSRWVDATGRRLVANNNTLENRGIDWSGYNVRVSGNDVEVFRHLLKTGPYLSVDGEGILIQECCGGTLVNGLSITDNVVNSYIGLYKTRAINNAYIARNVVTQGQTDISDLIYVAADTNGATFPISNTVVEENTITGAILFRGNAGSGTGNVVRNNVNPNGNGRITYSTETNVVLENNIGFPTVIPE